MEQETCMICSNPLTEEEKLFHPCECSFKYCFYCFKDLFEKLSGSRQGKCPQCQSPVKARIQVPPNPSLFFPSDKSKLREIRIICRDSIYIKQVPSSLSLDTLRSSSYFGKYGQITHLSIDLKYFQEDLPETYRVFLSYSSKLSAAKALIAVNGLVLNNKRMQAEYLVLNFCGNFLRSKKCSNSNCKFLHQVPAQPDWFWFKDLAKTDLTVPKNLEKVEKSPGSPFPEVELSFKVKQEIVMPKRSSKYTPKYIPVASIHFKAEDQGQSDYLEAGNITELKNVVQNRPTKGGVFSLLCEDD